jgi:hypothetical protein
VEDRIVRRTWYRKRSDGTFFRNLSLIMAERERTINPLTTARLTNEWDECWRQGLITATAVGRHDRWIDYDDSPEATTRWVEQTLAAHSRSTT